MDTQESLKPIVFIHDIVEANGKTIKQNNLARQHRISLGTLVEVKWDAWFGEGACWKVHARLWVVSHDRDCDGTPLYSLSRWNDAEFALQVKDFHHGFGEESLTPVKVTQELLDGGNALEWPESD